MINELNSVEKQLSIQVEEKEILRAEKELTATTRLPADAAVIVRAAVIVDDVQLILEPILDQPATLLARNSQRGVPIRVDAIERAASLLRCC